MSILIYKRPSFRIFVITLSFLYAGNILAQPVADFSATPVIGCAPLSVTFTDLSTGNPTSWKWDLGNGTISVKQNPSVFYFAPGQYKVTLIVKNANGSDTTIKDNFITVPENPKVNFNGEPASGCLPLPVQFNDQSTAAGSSINTWKWDFGDGSTALDKNPQHTYTTLGTFDVTLQVKDVYGCSGIASKQKYINTSNSVVAKFSNNIQNDCKPPVTLNFKNLSSGSAANYQWDFGDGAGSMQINTSHTYSTAGNFTVQLIASGGAGMCSDTIKKTIVIGTVTPGFSSPQTVCSGTSFLIINNNTPAASGIFWDFGDGTTSNDLNPVKAYTTAGNYIIKMVADFGACRDSVSKTITVLSKQTVAFTADNTAACKTPFTVNFKSNVFGANGYSWDFGDGATSPGANPSHTYNTPGNYDVTLVTTNSSGCQDTLKKIQYIKIETATISFPDLPIKNCVPFTSTFKANITSPEPVVKYTWDFGDGTFATLATPSHTFTMPGSYTIALTIVTSSGCTTTTKVPGGVLAGSKPAANFNASPRVACASIPIQFANLSTGNVNEWLWNFGDKTSSRSQNPNHIYLDTGYFNVGLIVWSNGCPDSIKFSNYIYIKPPVSKFGSKANCTNPNLKIFTDSSKGADSWEWNFGDGSLPSTARNPGHIYPDTGVYTVSLKVTNFSTGCDNTSTKNVQVIKEKAMFTASDTSLCKGSTTYFKSQNNPSKISTYNWNFGDGSPAQIVKDSVSHSYTNSGSFNVRLIINNVLGCKDTLVKPMYINVNGPIAKFSSIQSSCANTSINFLDNSVSDGEHSIIRVAWDFGDSTGILSVPPFIHTYTKAGTYSVTLRVTDSNGCTDTLVKKNYIFISKPFADFTTLDSATCPSAVVQFTGLSQGVNLTYLWNFGDGNKSVEKDPVHQYASTDNFTVSLKIADQYGCTDSMEKVNFISATLPMVGFTLNDSVSACPPFLAIFTNTSKNYNTLFWDFGDGNTSTSTTPTHFYYLPGTYLVKLKATGPGGCFDEKFNSIVVKGPKGTFNYTNITGCKIVTTDFKASAKDNLSFLWDFNDGTTVKTSDSSISHTYTDAGYYLPKLILEDENGCKVPVSGIDTIKVISVQANFNALQKVLCDAGDVVFKDSSISNDVVSNWLWNFGDGNTSTQQNPFHTYTSAGLYNVSQVISTENGCRDTAVKNQFVKIVASPDITIQGRAIGCELDTLNFKGFFLQPDSSIVTWQWNFGNGQASALQNPLPQRFTPSGNYTVTAVAANSSGCKDTAIQSVTIHPLPGINAGDDIFLCLGSTAQLQASGANNYEWILPTNNLSCINCADPVTNTPDDITYKVKGTNNFGCIAFDSIYIDVKKPFTITVTPSQDSLCLGQSVQLNAAGAENYLWSPANSLNSSVIKNPIASPHANINYKVFAYDSANCFNDSAFVNVTVFENPVVDAGANKTIKSGSSVLLSPVYSSDVTNWLWTPGNGLSCTDCAAPLAKPNVTTTYTINVKNNAGCFSNDNVTIFATCTGENIFIPNTFSPNGDGVNDIFYPRGIGLNKIRGMKIFNRWGDLVFERSNFNANDPSSGWNGLVGGKKVPSDVYTFVIDVICDNNDVIPQTGNITLLK